MNTTRGSWNSNIGFLLAAIGSAIGLGNVWRFSYMAHQYGGGAFLVPYVVALVIAGIPLMILEYGVGHRFRGSSPLCFAVMGRQYEWLGWWMPVVAMFGIMLYYSVIIGWCVNYLFFAIDLSWGSDPQAFFFDSFLQLSKQSTSLGSVRLPIMVSTAFVWLACWVICYRDIRHGIERASKLFMPVLFALTLILVFWTMSLDGAWGAITGHYLSADWSKINIFAADSQARAAAGKVWSAAFGQIFFTLSVGFGIMITYASYLPAKSNLTRNALITSITNCLYSFIAGFAVFGIVGFMATSRGLPFDQVIKGGPQLAFVVYPKAISMLPEFNSLFGVLFFLMLVIAGLTSGVSLIEAFACSLIDKFAWPRKYVVTGLCLAGFAGSILYTTNGGLYLLDIADHFITNYGLVAGGLLECLLVGWIVKASVIRAHVAESGGGLSPLWSVFVSCLTPTVLAYLLYLSLVEDVTKGYEGYAGSQLLVVGVGALIVCGIVAWVLTRASWKNALLTKKHHPGEDDLLT